MIYCGRTDCRYNTKSWYETVYGGDAYHNVCSLDHCEYHGEQDLRQQREMSHPKTIHEILKSSSVEEATDLLLGIVMKCDACDQGDCVSCLREWLYTIVEDEE